MTVKLWVGKFSGSMEVQSLETHDGLSIFAAREKSDLGGYADKLRILDPSNTVMLMLEVLDCGDARLEKAITAMTPLLAPFVSHMLRILTLNADQPSWLRVCDELRSGEGEAASPTAPHTGTSPQGLPSPRGLPSHR